METYFSIGRAAKLADLSPAMVDYLGRHGIVRPSGALRAEGRGIERRYTFSDVVLLRTLSGLLKKGISALRLKEAIKTLQKKYPQITPDKLPYRFLVTDGKWAIFKSENHILENLNRGGQFEFSFVVDMEPIRNDVLSRIEKFPISKDTDSKESKPLKQKKLKPASQSP